MELKNLIKGKTLLVFFLLTTACSTSILTIPISESRPLHILDSEYKFSLLALLINIFVSLIFFYLFKILDQKLVNHKESRIVEKSSNLEAENQLILAQYNALKKQLNPHFFFNSLNSLSTLVYKDPSLSDQFIGKFSEIFRYSLENKKSNYATLKEELKYIEAYMFLQKTRHGANLTFHQNVHLRYFNSQVPALSLQTVVENAFRHNSISRSQQLVVEIKVENEIVYVSNTFNPRNIQKATNLEGQKNLFEHYKTAQSNLPKFYVEDGFYYAALPLLNTGSQ